VVDSRPIVNLSDGKFYYRCTLTNLSGTQFTAAGLPEQFDDQGLSEITLILPSCLIITIGVKYCSTQQLAKDGSKDIKFRILDPPILWKNFINKI
jgi:hypothetical protein